MHKDSPRAQEFKGRGPGTRKYFFWIFLSTVCDVYLPNLWVTLLFMYHVVNY